MEKKTIMLLLGVAGVAALAYWYFSKPATAAPIRITPAPRPTPTPAPAPTPGVQPFTADELKEGAFCEQQYVKNPGGFTANDMCCGNRIFKLNHRAVCG